MAARAALSIAFFLADPGIMVTRRISAVCMVCSVTGVAFLSPAIAVDGTPITARVAIARMHRRMRVETGQVEMRTRMASPKLSFAGESVGFWRYRLTSKPCRYRHKGRNRICGRSTRRSGTFTQLNRKNDTSQQPIFSGNGRRVNDGEVELISNRNEFPTAAAKCGSMGLILLRERIPTYNRRGSEPYGKPPALRH